MYYLNLVEASFSRFVFLNSFLRFEFLNGGVLQPQTSLDFGVWLRNFLPDLTNSILGVSEADLGLGLSYT